MCAYDWPCDEALTTVWCESRDEAAVIGAGRYVGWFQVDGGDADPEANTREAYDKWRAWQRGDVPNPWPACWRN